MTNGFEGSQGTRGRVAGQVAAAGAVALVAALAWAGWLGWDGERDVHPDGSVSGPYEVWQVLGLVLTLLVPVCGAVFRRYAIAAVFGTAVGLASAAAYDWSDDASGLYMLGAGLVLYGSLAVTGVLAAVLAALMRRGGAGHPAR
ncbi:hypothetical protein [Streptomyces sp. NPDC097619]|uniref:hypothetical protein n=1 Tax=Streptomyces sp. NPDC097619 TaxID=3157228 RepID=UPI00331F5E93